jgi:hypothetical protein
MSVKLSCDRDAILAWWRAITDRAPVHPFAGSSAAATLCAVLK